jgi:hypothetical protein
MNRFLALAAIAPLAFAGIPSCTSQQVSTAISDACLYGPVIVDIASGIAKGGAAGPTGVVGIAQGLIGASCTPAGQAALAANDAAPVTATNSGDSAGWIMKTATDALNAAKASATGS